MVDLGEVRPARKPGGKAEKGQRREDKHDEGEAGPGGNMLHCKRVVRAVDYFRATNIVLVEAMTVRR